MLAAKTLLHTSVPALMPCHCPRLLYKIRKRGPEPGSELRLGGHPLHPSQAVALLAAAVFPGFTTATAALSRLDIYPQNDHFPIGPGRAESLACQLVRRTIARKSLTGSAPIAREIAINSTTSMRRSPPSYLATKDCGFLSRLATSCWVRPAFLRAAIISSQKAICPGEWMDLSMPRAREAIGAGN